MAQSGRRIGDDSNSDVLCMPCSSLPQPDAPHQRPAPPHCSWVLGAMTHVRGRLHRRQRRASTDPSTRLARGHAIGARAADAATPCSRLAAAAPSTRPCRHSDPAALESFHPTSLSTEEPAPLIFRIRLRHAMQTHAIQLEPFMRPCCYTTIPSLPSSPRPARLSIHARRATPRLASRAAPDLKLLRRSVCPSPRNTSSPTTSNAATTCPSQWPHARWQLRDPSPSPPAGPHRRPWIITRSLIIPNPCRSQPPPPRASASCPRSSATLPSPARPASTAAGGFVALHSTKLLIATLLTSPVYRRTSDMPILLRQGDTLHLRPRPKQEQTRST